MCYTTEAFFLVTASGAEIRHFWRCQRNEPNQRSRVRLTSLPQFSLSIRTRTSFSDGRSRGVVWARSLFTRDTILLSSYLPLNFWRVQISANAQLPLMHQYRSELYLLYLEKRRIIFFFDLNLQISFEKFGLYYVQSC